VPLGRRLTALPVSCSNVTSVLAYTSGSAEGPPYWRGCAKKLFQKSTLETVKGRFSALRRSAAAVLTYCGTLRSGAQKSPLDDSPERLLKQSLRPEDAPRATFHLDRLVERGPTFSGFLERFTVYRIKTVSRKTPPKNAGTDPVKAKSSLDERLV
jgi:hypothetical protein